MAEMSLRDLAIRTRRCTTCCAANPTWVSGQKWGPVLQGRLDTLLKAARANAAALRARKKEVAEKNTALAPLGHAYATSRLQCLAVDPGLMLAEFRSGTTGEDDFAINMDALVDHLETELKRDTDGNVPLLQRRFEFAEEALNTLRPLRATYDKEAAEADQASDGADLTTAELAAASAAAMADFTTFRKLVRAKFGDRSKEAAALRNPPATRRGAPATPAEPADPDIDAVLPALPG
ncbi:MAG: hypothetical protein HY904_14435 [Deltaproteobacteria bacterium]|nr:hypothetical protein [Deltaproteobacteria bacterium]